MQTHRIMLVDDESGVLAALSRLLRHSPLSIAGQACRPQVEAFTSAREALARAAERAYDLVISDYRMPEMDGVALLNRMREMQPGCARVILSGYTDLNGLISAINDARIDRFVAKPWNDFELTSALSQILQIRMLRMENEDLANQVRCERGHLTAEDLERQRLEQLEPGITQVQWGPDGSVLMDDAALLPELRAGWN
ncbi:MAG: response regulator [Vitreoscilla sp.]|nr:response regulator [Vitreoscilla sp.]